MISELATLYALIKQFEGCKLMPYLCPAGVWTCGFGSTGPDVIPGKPWTMEYAERRLRLDAAKFARATVLLCPGISGESLCAIADFAYNLGVGRLKASTLRRKINARDWEAAGRELCKWVNGGGRKLPGLVKRREVERAILLLNQGV